MVGGLVGEPHRRRGIEGDAVGEGKAESLRAGDLFREPAMHHMRDHPVAHLEAADAGADRRDHAGRVLAGRERDRRVVLILAVEREKVGEVDPQTLTSTTTSSSFAEGSGTSSIPTVRLDVSLMTTARMSSPSLAEADCAVV